MSNGIALAQPICLDVAADGRLISADAPVMRLHLLAGGTEDGMLIIPGLATIAAATHKYNMRLARAVIIADEDDDIDVWVESELIDGAARLKITGWRTHNIASGQGERADQLDSIDGHTQLEFNRDLRLVSISAGDAELGFTEIGTAASDLFMASNAGNIALVNAMESHVQIHVAGINLQGSSQEFSIQAMPRFAKDGEFLSYQCQMVAIQQKAVIETAPEPSGQLFGAQLGTALRQPLGRIIANAETIGSKLQGPIRDSYAVYAKDIADAARHLVALVDDLGDLEAIEKPGFTTAKDSIELGDIARRAAGLLALKAADHHIKINVPDTSTQIFATAEFRRVLQILINLLTNAVRYSPDGTQVTIQIGSVADLAFLVVEDQGAGVNIADHEKIFEKFERLGRSGDGGSGLGLYISRHLARFMGGDLTVSNAEQGGAIFTLTLPR
jgi:nitrogen-specific signal transduction histidine kinase